MDAAWALYEAWLKIKMGEVETALVYGFGKSSAGQLRRVLALQLDPYVVTPLWPDSVSIAGIQARLGLEAGLWSEKDLAEVAARGTTKDVAELLDTPYYADPLRRHDIAPITDGAAVVVLSTVERARDIVERPAVIAGIEHRVDSPVLGARDLTRSPSTEAAAKALDLDGADLAELHAPFTHQELIGDGVKINPSGGALAANPMFSAGLSRIGEAAARIHSGESRKAVAHATSGPALQQNLVTVLEAR